MSFLHAESNSTSTSHRQTTLNSDFIISIVVCTFKQIPASKCARFIYPNYSFTSSTSFYTPLSLSQVLKPCSVADSSSPFILLQPEVGLAPGNGNIVAAGNPENPVTPACWHSTIPAFYLPTRSFVRACTPSRVTATRRTRCTYRGVLLTKHWRGDRRPTPLASLIYNRRPNILF